MLLQILDELFLECLEIVLSLAELVYITVAELLLLPVLDFGFGESSEDTFTQ